MMTDDDYLRSRGIEMDMYAFSERVSIKLADIDQPTDPDIHRARQQALQEVKQ